MESRLGLVIAVDGLRASALGTYGNTSFPTPYMDALAARSLVAEWLLGISPKLSDFYEAAWDGFAGKLQQARVRTCLLTDDPWIADQARKEHFLEVILFEAPKVSSACRIEDTHFTRFFSQAIEQLASWQKEVAEKTEHGLLWVHLQGLTGPWDAPLEMRMRLLDEEDPEPLPIVEPPAVLPLGEDPDLLLSYQVGYGAQIELLDSCVSGFIEAFEAMEWSAPRLAMLVGSRGFALGEHGVIGHSVENLFSEQLHLPWIVHASGMEFPYPRVNGFAHPADLGATLLDWFGCQERSSNFAESLLKFASGDGGRLRQIALAQNPSGERMIRTPAWMLQASAETGSAEKLFVKPDDRWEVNDVASRCHEIVAKLHKLLDLCHESGEEGLDLHPIELPRELAEPHR